MATHRTLLSSANVTTAVVVLALAAVLCDARANENEVIKGKVGELTTTKVFVRLGWDVKLKCDLGNASKSTNNSRPRWSFFKQGNRIHTDLASFCTSTNETTSNCEVKLDEEDKGSTLELDNVSESNFGEYVCQLEEGNVIMNKTFSVQDKETVSIGRIAHAKHVDSVIVTEGSDLELYCNVTGFKGGPPKITWLKDKVDITKNLTGGEDIFKGFKHPNGTLTDEFFVGPARLEHRGNYTCQVSSQPNVFWVPSRPVQYEVRVRVHEYDRWTVPAYILMGEIAFIGIFTYFISRREKRLEEEADKPFEDSEASEDETNEQKTNNGRGEGGQNNNSNNRKNDK